MSAIVGNNKTDDKPLPNGDGLSFSAKELDWLLRKMSEIKVSMSEMEIASALWNRLSKVHRKMINEQHKIEIK